MILLKKYGILIMVSFGLVCTISPVAYATYHSGGGEDTSSCGARPPDCSQMYTCVNGAWVAGPTIECCKPSQTPYDSYTEYCCDDGTICSRPCYFCDVQCCWNAGGEDTCYIPTEKLCCRDGRGTACDKYNTGHYQKVCCVGSESTSCYNYNTEQCCPGNNKKGHKCPKPKECCISADGDVNNCCDPLACEDCNETTGKCDSICGDCETCDGAGNCIDCNDAGLECCDEKKCYDPNTHKCCGDGAGQTCAIDKTCCNGNCCDADQCCINGECKDPICDNCHSINDTVYECGHYPEDTTCASDWCIIDILDTVTCDYHSGSPCPSNCKVETVAGQPAIWQRKINMSSPICLTGGEPVHYEIWRTIYQGCETCSETAWRTSCETFGCPGTVEYSVPRGDKMACAGNCP